MRRLFTTKKEEKICELYLGGEGLSTRQLAKKFECSQGTIINAIHRRGFELRSPSEAKVGFRNPNWGGGRKETSHGFIKVYSPEHPFRTRKNYVPEHRLIMERKLGRYLDPKEVVHHINGVKNDNRPKNLMLFKNGAEHTRYHKKLRDIIKEEEKEKYDFPI